MSAWTAHFDGGTAWNTLRARWLIVAVHVVVICAVPVLIGLGTPGAPASIAAAAAALPVALAILALQLRHSFAIARGERPPGAWWTLLALVLLVYVPNPWFNRYWVSLQACVIASVPMVLRGWRAAVAIAAPVVGTGLAVLGLDPYVVGRQAGVVIYLVCYFALQPILLAVGLYGSARLVRLLDELQETRAELAALAVGQERLRVSRDLHDLLGQSLSAVSLKGDLALRLLRGDPPAAQAEIESLTGLARDALQGIRAVSRDEHAVSLPTEIEGAVALLSAAGIDARVDLDFSDVAPLVEHMLAWTVREGVANTLRHSHASSCSITGGRRDGTIFLEIVNDGAPTLTGRGGSGLAGLSERVRSLSGSMSAGPLAEGEFRLLVKVPEEG